MKSLLKNSIWIAVIVVIGFVYVLTSNRVESTQEIDAVFVRRLVDGSVYEFSVDGNKKTYRCTFCPFQLSRDSRGSEMTLRVMGGRVYSIELKDGAILSDESAKPHRLRWYAVVVLCALILVLIRKIHKSQKLTKGA